jgi:hypothetical protein
LEEALLAEPTLSGLSENLFEAMVMRNLFKIDGGLKKSSLFQVLFQEGCEHGLVESFFRIFVLLSTDLED